MEQVYRIRIQELNSGKIEYYPEYLCIFKKKKLFYTKSSYFWYQFPGTVLHMPLVCNSEEKALKEIKKFHDIQVKNTVYKDIKL